MKMIHRSTSRRLVRSIIAILIMVLGFLGASNIPLYAEGAGSPHPNAPYRENTLGKQSDFDLWRALKQGTPGLATTKRAEDGVAINTDGVWWAQLRQSNGPIIRYGATGLVAIIGVLSLFFMLRGRLKISGGRSHKKIARFSVTHRVVHWGIAVLFLLLAFTGLVLLFGRPLLIPVIGKAAFGVLATASMQAHNLFGPIFILSLIALFVTFVRGNFPTLTDIKWALSAGGMFGGHASSGRYNAGEKAWFWVAILAGLTLSASGILLSFPDALGTRNLLQLSQLSHVIAALVFIGFAFGHIYLATIGTQGTLEGMIDGEVDENWARTHHDQWFAEIKAAKGVNRQ